MKPFYRFCWLLVRWAGRFFWNYRVTGAENVPATGGVILACNHRAYVDPPLIGAGVKRELAFFAKAELFRIPLLGWLIRSLNSIPIRRHTYDRQGITQAISVIKQGQALVVFPEGTRCRSDDFLSPKPGIGWLALEARVPIIPTYIENSNHLWRALFLRRGVTVRYGKMIPAEWLASLPSNKKSYRIVTEAIMLQLRVLKGLKTTGGKTVADLSNKAYYNIFASDFRSGTPVGTESQTGKPARENYTTAS